jgi:hypothetical protein
MPPVRGADEQNIVTNAANWKANGHYHMQAA